MTKIIFVIIIFCIIFIQKAVFILEFDFYNDTIEQKLDHFNDHDERVFKQDYKYTIDLNSKIVFLYLSGEKSLNKSAGILSGQIPNSIPLSYFNLIHRFYGDTVPEMPPTEYIKYLNISQSLEDIKNFIEKMNEQFNLQTSNWIIGGCFYSGTLAALARQRFPPLIKGAVAVSAPLKTSLYIDFMDTVIEKMKSIDENKTVQIQNAIEKYYNYTTTFEGQEYLSNLLSDDYFMSNNETECYPAFYDPTKFFAEATEDGIIVDFFERWNNESFETFMELIITFAKRNDSEGHQQQAWQHQLCTEFGFFRTTSSQKSLDFFGDSIPKICPELICDQLEKSTFLNSEYTFEDSVAGVEKTNQIFGTPEKFNATNAIFIIPEFDPWISTFLLETENPGIEIIFSDNQFHCGVDEKSTEKWISSVLKWLN